MAGGAAEPLGLFSKPAPPASPALSCSIDPSSGKTLLGLPCLHPPCLDQRVAPDPPLSFPAYCFFSLFAYLLCVSIWEFGPQSCALFVFL